MKVTVLLVEQYFFGSISFPFYFIFYASIVNVYHLVRKKNEWIKMQNIKKITKNMKANKPSKEIKIMKIT